MKTFSLSCIAALALLVFSSMKEIPAGDKTPAPAAGWVSLFDGKSLNNWKISEHPETFSVKDGSIMVFGERAHLFYEGPVGNHNFKNFEFKAQVMTTPGSNSGIFVHT